MKQNKKIAVTGGIGSGKSLFCSILKTMGYAVFSCDEIYSEMMEETDFLTRLQNRFPDCFPNGKLNKTLLAELIFRNREEKAALDRLTHPLIMKRLLDKMKPHNLSFAEVPLLYEGGFEGLFDGVIALVRNKEERIKAVMARSGLTEKEVLHRMENQFDPVLLSDKNCLIIENHGSEADLKRKAEKILKEIRYE